VAAIIQLSKKFVSTSCSVVYAESNKAESKNIKADYKSLSQENIQ